mmetsp:Transcript_1005/g.1587  ORF Transcript_1005/g.1587 Transcript_1005/m.1587 type:complete len:120 (-) Transcript_1005:16-375(-)
MKVIQFQVTPFETLREYFLPERLYHPVLKSLRPFHRAEEDLLDQIRNAENTEGFRVLCSQLVADAFPAMKPEGPTCNLGKDWSRWETFYDDRFSDCPLASLAKTLGEYVAFHMQSTRLP